MLNREFIEQCFQAKSIGNLSIMKALIEKLAHSSIMRLGQDSLDKLFELMLMAVKYQMVTVTEPRLLFDVTSTHIESWHRMTDDPEIILLIQHAHGLLFRVSKLFVSNDAILSSVACSITRSYRRVPGWQYATVC